MKQQHEQAQCHTHEQHEQCVAIHEEKQGRKWEEQSRHRDLVFAHDALQQRVVVVDLEVDI